MYSPDTGTFDGDFKEEYYAGMEKLLRDGIRELRIVPPPDPIDYEGFDVWVDLAHYYLVVTCDICNWLNDICPHDHSAMKELMRTYRDDIEEALSDWNYDLYKLLLSDAGINIIAVRLSEYFLDEVFDKLMDKYKEK